MGTGKSFRLHLFNRLNQGRFFSISPAFNPNHFHRMNRSRLLIFLLSLLVPQVTMASPAEAQRIQKSHQLAMDQWILETKTATGPEAQEKVRRSRPDAAPFVRKIWEVISPSLKEEWTLEPAAWFLKITPGLLSSVENSNPTPIFSKECDAIRKAVETHHLSSPKLIPICAALATASDSRSLSLLEKIQSSHPNPKVQGVAALAAAIQLKSIGDDAEIMRKRLTYLRKAIIESSDIDLNGSTVAKLAEDELYIIRFLTKGRVAPDLIGMDSGKRPISLSAHQGKIIVLVFWNSSVPSADRVIEITSSLAGKFRGRPLVVMGVNSDPVEKLRSLQETGAVSWPNFSDPDNTLANAYRVGAWPLVYVLDGERKIHYAGAPGSFAELTAEALVAEIKPTVTE